MFSWLQIDSGGKYENTSETSMFLDLGTADGAVRCIGSDIFRKSGGWRKSAVSHDAQRSVECRRRKYRIHHLWGLYQRNRFELQMDNRIGLRKIAC